MSYKKSSWYVMQIVSGKESKIKKLLKEFIKIKNLKQYLLEILIPEEKISEIKKGKKRKIVKRFFPGYIFIKIFFKKEEFSFIFREINFFIQKTVGAIKIMGNKNPIPLKNIEIEKILQKTKSSKEKINLPRIDLKLEDKVKINKGPFMNLIGRIIKLDHESGKIKVIVSIFGRMTPIELEYWQVSIC
jgi:transcriptional antiterminator NusG